MEDKAIQIKRETFFIQANNEKTIKSKSCSSLESYTLTLSLASEDEGLGDDGRREFSGPNSLSDLQLSSDEECNQLPERSRNQPGASNVAAKSSEGFSAKYAKVVGPVKSCPNCSKRSALEQQVKMLVEERNSLQEQVLELEEAENDARLVSQRLQRQVENLVGQVECLHMTLSRANHQIEENNEEIKKLREEELKLKVDFMMALISRHEESPGSFLDDLKEKLKEKRSELDQLHPVIGSDCGHENQHPHRFLSKCQAKASNNSDANDCEIFIPEDSLLPNLGSSFHVKTIKSRLKRSQSTLTAANSNSSKSVATPICETVKPKKIDLIYSE